MGELSNDMGWQRTHFYEFAAMGTTTVVLETIFPADAHITHIFTLRADDICSLECNSLELFRQTGSVDIVTRFARPMPIFMADGTGPGTSRQSLTLVYTESAATTGRCRIGYIRKG